MSKETFVVNGMTCASCVAKNVAFLRSQAFLGKQQNNTLINVLFVLECGFSTFSKWCF